MLHIKRLELQGFKSFPERTELRFNGFGFTAIVGPNGCGKSNLADAISWVLGEQSAKSLRGSRMEDVIFAGTRDRKALGMASVTLTLVDPDPQPETAEPAASNGHHRHYNGKPVGPKEITITRRLYRSGESEYLIDGRHARLRDIQDIFIGTGLGPESYAIIEQGRISQLLSTKPQERRAVIEEAAGTGKFKTRRRLAEAKLEAARQNLARVFDILEEVGRQANSLKRQAAKARRWEELNAELTGYLRKALAGRYQFREREAAKAALDLNESTRRLEALSEEVIQKEKLQGALQEQCFALEAELTARRHSLSELRLEMERSKGRLDAQTAQIAAMEERLAQGETEIREIETRLRQLETEHQTQTAAVVLLEQQREELTRALGLKTSERNQRREEVQRGQEALESGRRRLLELLGESSNLKNQLAQVTEYLSGLEREESRLRREEQSAADDLARLNAHKEELAQRIAARQLELSSISDQRLAAEQQLQARKAQAGETRKRLEAVRAELSRIKARRDSTQDVLSHRSYTTESVKQLFNAIERGQAGTFEPLGVLADFLEVDPEWEKAAEEFLHEELECVVVRDWDQAHRGIDLMRSSLDGRATFLVHPDGSQDPGAARLPAPTAVPETGTLGPLAGRLRLTNGLTETPIGVVARIAHCFLVEDRAIARQLALQYPDLYFLLPDGVSYHGHAVSGGKKTGSGPLALKRELRELNRAVAEKQKQAAELETVLQQLEADIAVLVEGLEVLRARQQAQEKEALALEHEMRKHAENANRLSQRLSVVRLELDRLTREREQAKERKASMASRLDSIEQQRAAQEQELEATRGSLAELEGLYGRLAEEHSALRASLAGLEERRQSARQAQARQAQQIHDLTARLRHLSAEIAKTAQEGERLRASNQEIETQLAELSQAAAGLEQAVAALASEEQQTRTVLAQAEEDLRGLRAAASSAQESRAQTEIQLVKLQSELRYMEETCQKELRCSLAELIGDQETLPAEEELADAERRCQELRTRIENLGPVNPQALEEYEQTQHRYDFLNAQRQDLLDSIRDTEKAIQEIDAESRRRFSQAFEAINANFREMFKTLFDGGSAEMRLTDPDNQHESGIDIMASPPGKRLQNVLLLSGGERTLTAMALLFAIFQYNPSPFCVLDEVDAPLDEANIGRLVRLLKRMAARTQFIIITHAKRTMEASETLYGVTMQEPGVSKIVSVRFQEPAQAPPSSVSEYAMAAGAD